MLCDGLVEMPGSVAESDVRDVIHAFAGDQCCRDVHGCLVASRASDVVVGLAVLTRPSR